MVYTATSLSLAMVELFVHLDAAEAPDDLVSFAATLPSDPALIEQIDIQQLPADWRLVGNPKLRTLGAHWITGQHSLALRAPSAVVKGEWNVLLNPEHPAFHQIKVEPPEPFHFDTRMFKRRS